MVSGAPAAVRGGVDSLFVAVALRDQVAIALVQLLDAAR